MSKSIKNRFNDIQDPNCKGPLLSNNCLSNTFFGFAIKVFKLGNQKHFLQKDCWGIKKDFCFGFN